MSITEELRKFAWKECPSKFLERVIGIADDIDKKHEAYADFAHRMKDAASKGEEVTIFGTDYIPLPKDADGETIRIGDELEWLDGYNKTIEVVELRYGRSGWVLISRDGNAYVDTFAFTHVRPDSWERIIEDVRTAEGCGSVGEFMERRGPEFIERCKRLAGDAE